MYNLVQSNHSIIVVDYLHDHVGYTTDNVVAPKFGKRMVDTILFNYHTWLCMQLIKRTSSSKDELSQLNEESL